MRSRLGYLHMPKAAGTSIRAAFAAYYDQADTVPYSFDRHLFGNDPRIDEIREPLFLGDPSELTGYRYMEGHWALPTMAAVIDPADIVCVLREPRARFLSHYTFWRGWPDSMHELWEPYQAAKYAQLALGDYCREPAIAHQADNLVTRLILGPHPLVPDGDHIRVTDIDRLAAEASERLDDLGYVDVLERGDEVYGGLETWFGAPLSRERLNETDLGLGEPLDLDDFSDGRTLGLVNDRNASDLQVWHHVAERRGLKPGAARSNADAAYGQSVAKIAAAHAVLAQSAAAVPDTPQPDPADGTARPLDSAPTSRPQRFVGLLRRGPRAVWHRMLAEVEHRRRRAA